MKKIVLVFAMEKERDAVLALLSTKKPAIQEKEGVHRFVFDQQIIWLLHVGVTMINAYKLAVFLERHHVDEVINVGTCAGLRNLRIGDVIHSHCFYHHEIDLSFFPQSLGYLQEDPKTYHQHPVLVSGNTFLASKEEVQHVISKFDADAFDMESFGLYAICKPLNIPFSVIRGVTDDGQDHAEYSFEENLELASKEAAKYVLNHLNI